MAEGRAFGRYQLVDLLGRGGMGEVWRAFDSVTERVVAIKVLPAQFADDLKFQARFRREARAAAGLNDPHIVPIHDFGEIDGQLFVTMRLIEGQDLQSTLTEGPLPPHRAVDIIEQVASALHVAHRSDLVHRDVKPHNILIGEDDFAYLIDFGIARATGETALTSTGATLGTWAYMAPERFEQGTADARVDIYALTCVLYQTLTGQIPFPGNSLEQIAMAHMVKAPPRPSVSQSAVPAAMDDVIATGMSKNPEMRYPTTKSLATAARAALDGVATPMAASTAESVTHQIKPVAETMRATDSNATKPRAHSTFGNSADTTRVAPSRQNTKVTPSTPEGVTRRHSRRSGVIAAVLSTVGVIVVAAIVVAANVIETGDTASTFTSTTRQSRAAEVTATTPVSQPTSTTAATEFPAEVVPGNIPVGSTTLSNLNSAEIGSCMSRGQGFLMPQTCSTTTFKYLFRVTNRTQDPSDCARTGDQWVQATDTGLVLCLKRII